MAMNLQNFFTPRSIAVIGASSDKNKVGFAILSNLVHGAKRNLYPVTISEKEVLGLKSYMSVVDIKDEVDLAVIAVRADLVPQVLMDCVMKKIKAVTIISAGFRAMNEAGRELEERCAMIAKENDIALLGPNCLGTIDVHADLNASFAAQKPPKGNIAFLSQSGALGTSILDLAIREGVGFSKFISLGNEAQLTEIEFLEYLADDDETKAVLIYLEKLSDGPEFMRLISKISKTKPVVVLKAGRSVRGSRAIMSHTGSLAPESAVFSAACRQSGAIAVSSIREFFNLAKLFQLGITKPLQKFVILTNGGGPSVVATDLIDLSRSLSLVELSESTQNSLRKVLPPMAAFGNPVDIIGDALSSRYADALRILCDEKEVQGILLLLTPQMMTEVEKTAKLLVDYKDRKSIIPVFLGGPTIIKGLEFLKELGIPNFHFPIDAVEALDALALGMPKKTEGNPSEMPGLHTTNGDDIKGASISDVSSQNKVGDRSGQSRLSMLEYSRTVELLTNYGISFNGVLVKEKSDLSMAVSKIGGGPFALKAISPEIIHKTDMGAIRLYMKNVEEIKTAWDLIMAEISKKVSKDKIEGMLVQSMSDGKEVIIGMKRDPVFGPVILFGLGGIFTEVLGDTSLRVSPVTISEALAMIGEIKGRGILFGLRGEKSVNIEMLATLLVKISKMAVERPEIKEIDFNPVMASVDQVAVVDARVMV
jgi:acetate---CoA ligase (ADP-forming)